MKNIKKIVIFFLMVSTIFFVNGCKSADDSNKDNLKEKKNTFHEIVVDKADTSKNTAQSIVKSHLEYRKENKEIREYKISNIEIISDTETSFVFMCDYNMNPDKNYHDIDSEYIKSEGWLASVRTNFFNCTVDNNKVTLKSITSSPAM